MRMTRWARVLVGVVSLAAMAGTAQAQGLPLHSGDINGDGTRDVADITCYALATLTNVLGMPDPACQTVSDADADLQCEGLVNIVDVQQATIYVLYTLTGDPAIEALQQVNDFDLDFLDNRCDDDDDNDGFADICELDSGTDPLDPASPANGVICDDGVSCTVDTCDAATGCVHTPTDSLCDDGNPCTINTCDLTGDCQVAWNADPCDDGDPCTTGDTCAGGTCLPGSLAPACFVSRNTICSLSGATGDVVDCTLRVARAAQADPAATSLQVALQYDAAVLLPVGIADPAGGDVLATGSLPSGHTVAVLPDLANWNGNGGLVLSPSNDPAAALTAAYVQGTLPAGGPDVAGDPLVLTVQFQLLIDVDPAVGAEVTAEYLAGATADAQPLAATVEDTVVVTRPTGCTADPTLCDDGNPCTTDSCDAASDACVYAFADGTACDDGNPCTHGDTCSQGVCVGTLDVLCSTTGCAWQPADGACALDGTCTAWLGLLPGGHHPLTTGTEDFEGGAACFVSPPGQSCTWGYAQCGNEHSGSWALHFNGCGDYCNGVQEFVETKNIDLSGATSASVDFYARWSNVEPCCDYLRVEVVDATNSTVLAQPWQVNGSSGGWTPVQIDLNGYLGQSIRIRWVFRSDGSVNGGNIAVDDVTLNVTY